MSYAVIVTGGKQYKVAEGEFLKIEKLEVATGESVTFDRVLLVLSLIHISEPTRLHKVSRMPSSA